MALQSSSEKFIQRLSFDDRPSTSESNTTMSKILKLNVNTMRLTHCIIWFLMKKGDLWKRQSLNKCFIKGRQCH